MFPFLFRLHNEIKTNESRVISYHTQYFDAYRLVSSLDFYDYYGKKKHAEKALFPKHSPNFEISSYMYIDQCIGYASMTITKSSLFILC